ncbi:unnamed protein product [Pleuronectes platessa]|uniref:Uncharacterized protein n=1 Tax=Pleuronectes platessa TaxID=8262 RepID=A0A9N7U9Q0_PLEPL|nr:unnamed protein product [Pleuronectes platessa]
MTARSVLISLKVTETLTSKRLMVQIPPQETKGPEQQCVRRETGAETQLFEERSSLISMRSSLLPNVTMYSQQAEQVTRGREETRGGNESRGEEMRPGGGEEEEEEEEE